ncbi:thioredoxin [Sphingobium yanoikuyae]|jgi:thioredoxin-like negative regulator of GroEL|uniref:Thioredoxin n=1 Tax=Sphingobium yanoikuyae TaxID=13690 RepID=A0A177JX29_SPHYA|nr:thioredoxin family protein [Sphingobium yanoikuyae]OAH45376.1 thioredoxin [Sphingobium yanoikuyae]
MFTRMTGALFAATMLAAAPAHAAEFRDFDHAAFAAAQAEGRPILLDVHAWWCPVCASQNHTIKQTVSTSKAYDRLIIFRINYDKQKPVWQSFGVRKQATLIAFHGRQEVGRIQYMTNKDKINALLASTVR